MHSRLYIPGRDLPLLSHAQLKEIQTMQSELIVWTSDPRRTLVLRSLVYHGVAVHRPSSCSWELTPEWQAADLNPKKKWAPEKIRHVTPDPVVRIKRPKAVYSNESYEQRIERILNTY